MVERNEISRHEVEVFRVLSVHAEHWKTNAELAAECRDVSPRTVRAMTLKFVRLGLLDQAELFPAHKFRLSAQAAKRNRGYSDRLKQAADVFGVTI